MPTLNVITNVPADAVRESDAVKALSAAVASSVGKPEQYVLVSLRTGVTMAFAGTEAPTAYAELLSIGAIGGDKNKAISRALSDVLAAKLGLDAARVYIKFTDAARSDFGWNGSTF